MYHRYVSDGYSFFWKFSPDEKSVALEARVEGESLRIRVAERTLGEVSLPNVRRVYVTASDEPKMRWLVLETESGESLRVPGTATGVLQAVRDLARFGIKVPEEWPQYARPEQEDTLWQADEADEK
jgi:hypothetical protein